MDISIGRFCLIFLGQLTIIINSRYRKSVILVSMLFVVIKSYYSNRVGFKSKNITVNRENNNSKDTDVDIGRS